MQFRKDKAKPYTFSLVGFKGWLHITKQKNSGSRWKNSSIPALTLCKALPFCPQAHYKSLSQEQGGNRSSHASCVLVLFPPDLFNPVIPAFSNEKWPSAHRPCPRFISTPFQHSFPVSYTSQWPAVLSFRSELFCDAHNCFPVRKRHATHLLSLNPFYLISIVASKVFSKLIKEMVWRLVLVCYSFENIYIKNRQQ